MNLLCFPQVSVRLEWHVRSWIFWKKLTMIIIDNRFHSKSPFHLPHFVTTKKMEKMSNIYSQKRNSNSQNYFIVRRDSFILNVWNAFLCSNMRWLHLPVYSYQHYIIKKTSVILCFTWRIYICSVRWSWWPDNCTSSSNPL